MTILTAAVAEDGVWIGEDSRGLLGSRYAPPGDKKWKVSRDGQWAIGTPGEVTYDGILFHDPKWFPGNDLWPSEDGEDGLVELMHNMRTRFDECGSIEPIVDSGDTTRCYRVAPLVAWAGGGVWHIHSTLRTFDRGYYVLHKDGYMTYQANGSGREYALGAMHVMSPHVAGGADLVEAGIRAACEFESSCGPPIVVRRLPR